MSRQNDLDHFYELLDTLRQKLGGERLLSTCDASLSWPRQGVYFFFEPGEYRANGAELRVVRVGTHAIVSGARATLWGRLRAHRGYRAGRFAGGGNHRRSIFRLHVGTAMIGCDASFSGLATTWGKMNSAPLQMPLQIRLAEHPLEQKVSAYIGQMPFLWLRVDDRAGPANKRRYIERNAISLLSNAGKEVVIDPPSLSWLGHHCANPNVRASGLWNSQGVYDSYDPVFLSELKGLIDDV